MSDAINKKFITFEGGEGSGKSTQAKMLAEYLQSQGEEVVLTREPGGTEAGEQIRNLLIEGDSDKWHAESEVLLNFAARIEHVEKLIKPALENNKWVVCDRFFDSTYVYQGYAGGVELEFVDKIKALTLKDFAPHKTFLMDMEVEVALARAKARGDENRYERMGVDYHRKVRNGFLSVAENEKRCIIIDATKNIDQLHQEILGYIRNA